MSSILRTFVRTCSGQSLKGAAAEMRDVLGRMSLPPACRLLLVPDNPWLMVENLWFISLDAGRERATVETLARLWETETVMIGTQSVASCGIYAHYVGGTLGRFLSAGDGIWLEVFGTPEPWEAKSFWNDPERPYAIKSETTFDDRIALSAVRLLDCPTIDSKAEVVAVF